MTNEDAAFREVNQAMEEEAREAFFKKYAVLIAGGAATVVAGVGGYQIWRAQADARGETAALEFKTATETLAASPDDGRAALASLAESAPDGYALMAELRRAGSLADTDRAGALVVYRKVYDDGDAPKRLRQLARLRAAALSAADGRDAVLADLGDLTEDASALGYYARELSAAAALAAKDYETALSMFKKAADDVAAPEPVRQRAKEFAALANAGKAGVNLAGEARLEDLAKALNPTGGNATPEESLQPGDNGQPVEVQ